MSSLPSGAFGNFFLPKMRKNKEEEISENGEVERGEKKSKMRRGEFGLRSEFYPRARTKNKVRNKIQNAQSNKNTTGIL